MRGCLLLLGFGSLLAAHLIARPYLYFPPTTLNLISLSVASQSSTYFYSPSQRFYEVLLTRALYCRYAVRSRRPGELRLRFFDTRAPRTRPAARWTSCLCGFRVKCGIGEVYRHYNSCAPDSRRATPAAPKPATRKTGTPAGTPTALLLSSALYLLCLCAAFPLLLVPFLVFSILFCYRGYIMGK
ncbi:hypothetical protein VTK56DRAFT_523 [Thermocarpiscus australiensis]